MLYYTFSLLSFEEVPTKVEEFASLYIFSIFIYSLCSSKKNISVMPRDEKTKSVPNLIEKRYELLLKPGATIDSDESASEDDDDVGASKNQKYAAFLK